MTRHCIETPSERPTGEKIQKINCFGAVRKRTKPEEEKETTVSASGMLGNVCTMYTLESGFKHVAVCL